MHDIGTNPHNLLMGNIKNIIKIYMYQDSLLFVCSFFTNNITYRILCFVKKCFRKNHAFYIHLTYKHMPSVISVKLNSCVKYPDSFIWLYYLCLILLKCDLMLQTITCVVFPHPVSPDKTTTLFASINSMIFPLARI